MNKIEALRLSLQKLNPLEEELKKWYQTHGSLMPNDLFLLKSEQFQELNHNYDQSISINLDATHRNYTDANYDADKKMVNFGNSFWAYEEVPFFILKHPRYFPLMVYRTNQIGITYVYSGYCQTHVYINGEEEIFELNEGDFMFNPAYHELAHYVADDDSIIMNMGMTRALFQRMLNYAFPNGILVEFYTRYVCNSDSGHALIIRTKADMLARSLMEQVMLDSNETGQPFSEVTYLTISLLFAYMQREFGSDLVLTKVGKEPYIIPAMISYIQEHYQDFDGNSMAEYFHLNHSYLSRLFRRQTGFTINETVLDVRIKAAQRLLEYTNHSIEHISEQVGYADTSYFIEKFKKKVGMTPLQYRKKFLS